MSLNRITILQGDVRERLREIPDGTARCCVTSPPYWGLRDYGCAEQIGLEASLEDYVAELVAVFAEVRRVLTDDGTLWLNLGDAYVGGGRGGNPGDSAHTKQATSAGSLSAVVRSFNNRTTHGPGKPKDIIGLPWLVAFALRADGWWLRSDIVWAKPNPMPESVTDRPTRAHEYVFLARELLPEKLIEDVLAHVPEDKRDRVLVYFHTDYYAARDARVVAAFNAARENPRYRTLTEIYQVLGERFALSPRRVSSIVRAEAPDDHRRRGPTRTIRRAAKGKVESDAL